MEAESVPSLTVSVPLDVLPEYCLVADAKGDGRKVEYVRDREARDQKSVSARTIEPQRAPARRT